MIKLTGFAFQGANVEATIEFDLGGQTYSRTVSAQISQILNMTEAQIKTWIINFVANERRALQETGINNLLNPLVGVDLEP